MRKQSGLRTVAGRVCSTAARLGGGGKAVLGLLVCVPLLAAASSGWTQSSSFSWDDARAAQREVEVAGASGSDAVSALAAYAGTLSGGEASSEAAHAGEAPELALDPALRPLLAYVREIGGEQPQRVAAALPQGHPPIARDAADAALRDFADGLDSGEPAIRLAAAAKAKAVTPAKASSEAEATFVGSQACLGCHASHAAAFAQTAMGRIFKNPRTAQERGGCETCHGAGSLHVKAGGGRGVGGIISFRKNDTSRTVADNNAICLSCHDKGGRNYWEGSAHESREVACTDCHQVMVRVSIKAQLKKESELETCFQCHKDRRMQAQRSSHMPLREGKMVCSNCHNPHGSASEAMLKQASINDNCYSCHAEKRGPFLWEHPPVRENCLNCHEAHGSNIEHLLKVQRPRLCQDCHSIGHASQSPLVNTAFNRSCNNCHSQIHGSNHPSGVLFQR